MSLHMPSEVLQQRQEYDALGIDRDLLLEWSSMRALRDSWESNTWAAAGAGEDLSRRSAGHRAEMGPHESPPDTIAVYPAGADPDRFRGKRAGHVSRSQIERLIQGKADLVRPIAYLIDDEDLERLRRRASTPDTRPTFAVVSRPLPVVIDSREPYAIRFDGRVILAYCARDGRELVVLDPPGHRGFARLKARTADALEDLVVGQVVALSWFPL